MTRPARLLQSLKITTRLKMFYFYHHFRTVAQWIRARAVFKSIAVLVLSLMTFGAMAAPHLAQLGVVTRVVDGDTVWLKAAASGQVLKVRLQGIDAPEICQPGGVEAGQALKRQVLGQQVLLVSRAHDKYGRTVGTLHLQGQDMGRWLVSQGYAWVYSYRHKKGPYAGEMLQAQLAQRGLFSDPAAEEPRSFRKRHGSCYQRP
jgi:micrococcal nuclease